MGSSIASAQPAGNAISIATFAEGIATNVQTVARAMVNWAPRGFCRRVSLLMGNRPERRSREVAGVERLSLDTVLSELASHATDGRQEAVDALVAALLDGLKTASVPVRPDSLIELYGRDGQRFLRFER